MGLLQMANVPYVGCGMSASAVAMDKVLAKQVAEAAGVESNPWIWFYTRDLARHHRQVMNNISNLKYPLFVKPAHLGSSIAISKVEKESELTNALEVAAHYDDKVVVEESVNNLIEVTLPVMGNDEPVPALLEKPAYKPGDYFDWDTKYMQGGKKGKMGNGDVVKGAQGYSQIPAKLPPDLYKKAEQLALSVYRAIGCSGIARVDLLIDSKTEKVYFNEVNPLPGSLYAHNWKAAGVSNVELVTKLVNYAQERWDAQQKIATSFSTNFLKQF